MPLTNYILTPEDVDLIRQAVEKVLGRSISYAGQIALENLTNTDDLRNNVQIIIGESLQSGASGLTITFNETTGITTLTLDPDLAALALLSTTGLIARTGNGTVAARSITGATGIAVIDGNGVAGNPQITPANDLAALESLNSTGFAVRTGTEAWTQRSITAGTGLAVTNGDGVAGNPSVIPANDLAALESLSGTGIAVRTGSETWAQRTITGTAGRVSVANGNGVSGNPAIDLETAGTAGTYDTVTTDAYGRVISGVSGTVVSFSSPSATSTISPTTQIVMPSAAGITLTMPPVSGNSGRVIEFKSTASGLVTISAAVGDLIDGLLTASLAVGGYKKLLNNGTQWVTIG